MIICKQWISNSYEKNSFFIFIFSIGGIEVYAMEGKIKVSNTIDDRLILIFDQILPEIREKLFGINPNRKYQH